MPLPRIQAAFNGWEVPLKLINIVQVVDKGFVKKLENIISFKGVVQPLSPSQLSLKPSEQRSFRWWQIHVRSNAPLQLNEGDKIEYKGIRLKVMPLLRYSEYGYNEYHCIEDII